MFNETDWSQEWYSERSEEAQACLCINAHWILFVCSLAKFFKIFSLIKYPHAVSDLDCGLGEAYSSAPLRQKSSPFCMNCFLYGHCCAAPPPFVKFKARGMMNEAFFSFNVSHSFMAGKEVFLFPWAYYMVFISLFFDQASQHSNNLSTLVTDVERYAMCIRVVWSDPQPKHWQCFLHDMKVWVWSVS